MQEPIDGGCLCGAIRYNIQFPDGTHSLPESTTCQCTQCRKNSGALVAYFIAVASSNVSWIGSTPTSYSATPGFVRTFCKQCGSWLTWVDTNEPGRVSILMGTIDEVVLLGPRGKELTTVSHQAWCAGFIEGATDNITEGRRWEGDIGKSKTLN